MRGVRARARAGFDAGTSSQQSMPLLMRVRERFELRRKVPRLVPRNHGTIKLSTKVDASFKPLTHSQLSLCAVIENVHSIALVCIFKPSDTSPSSVPLPLPFCACLFAAKA